MQKNIGLKIVGALLIVVGLITIIISFASFINIQKSSTQWGEAFMIEAYENTKAQQSIPCYIGIAFGGAMIITGVILLALKRNKIGMPMPYINPYPYMPRSAVQVTGYCTTCGKDIVYGSKFCIGCGSQINRN